MVILKISKFGYSKNRTTYVYFLTVYFLTCFDICIHSELIRICQKIRKENCIISKIISHLDSKTFSVILQVINVDFVNLILLIFAAFKSF